MVMTQCQIGIYYIYLECCYRHSRLLRAYVHLELTCLRAVLNLLYSAVFSHVLLECRSMVETRLCNKSVDIIMGMACEMHVPNFFDQNIASTLTVAQNAKWWPTFIGIYNFLMVLNIYAARYIKKVRFFLSWTVAQG